MHLVDSHAHIFENGLELAPVRRYAPTYDAKVEDYLAVLDSHGVHYGVLLQPSFLGTNNEYMLKALRRYPERLRGIAVIEPQTSLEELEAMAAAGVVGIRLNLAGLPIPDFQSPPWPELLGHIRRLDWQVEVHRESRDLPFLIDPLLRAGVSVVVDHFGRPDSKEGANDLGFRYVLASASSRRVWVKLSGGYRNWPEESDQRSACACAKLLLETFGPERLIWGSDWPHTQNESRVDFALTQRRFETWVPDEADRRIILSETPLRLFRFGQRFGTPAQ